MAKPLVIVESPAKARTLGRFLGDSYRVEASFGHIRDLPESAAEVPKEIKEKEWGRLGVDVDSDFAPYYFVPNDKKSRSSPQDALKDASELLLATDPTGKASRSDGTWHRSSPKVPVIGSCSRDHREAFAKRSITRRRQRNLVRAQESRRILAGSMATRCRRCCGRRCRRVERWPGAALRFG